MAVGQPDFNEAFRLVIDNDQELHTQRNELILQHAGSVHEVGNLMDALRDWAEELVDLEGDANLLRVQLLGWVLDAIDWYEMTQELLESARRNGMIEYEYEEEG